MIFSRSTLSLCLPVLAFLSLLARASPYSRAASRVSTLKLAVTLNSNGIRNFAIADRARVELLQAGGSSSISANNTGLTYTADIGVGIPPTYYTLLIDTGSSNTWIGANKSYVKTSTSQDTGDTFSISYGAGFVAGEEYLDTVTINSDLLITNQSIGVAEYGTNAGLYESLDGILGLGPIDLTQGTVSSENEVPAVMDNLYEQGTISSEVLGMFFSPFPSDSTGELTFGGYDASKITGDINYVPVTSTYPSSGFWGINQTISYGTTLILNNTAGIVDSGTVLIYIPSDAFDKYQTATGSTLDSTTGLLTISPEQYNNLSSLYFQIGHVPYELTPNAQIWPRSLNTAIGGAADSVYLIVADGGSKSGSGLDFVNGFCFLERFYSVYDTTNARVGFATTEYTNATSN